MTDETKIRNEPRAWSLWGDRLLAALALALFASLALAWINLIYLNQPVDRILSFDPDDLGALTGRNDAQTVLGIHAFGDFQLPRLWGQEMLAGGYPDPVPPYLPMSFAYGALFSIFNPAWAVGLHQALSVALLAVSAWLLLQGVNRAIRIVVVALTSMMTLPMLAVLDTGNIQGLVIGLIALGIVLIQRRQLSWASVVLAVAISLKGYPIVILAWPLAMGYWAFAAKTAGIAIGANLILFATIPGGFAANIDRYIAALMSRPNQGMVDAESSLASLVIKLTQALGFSYPINSIGSTSIEVAAGAAWLALVVLVVRSRRAPEWLEAFLALSLLQMTVPTTYNYALGWASIAAIWFGQGRLLSLRTDADGTELTEQATKVLRWITLSALVATLTPLGFRMFVNGAVINASTVISPSLILSVGMLSAIIVWRRERTTVVPCDSSSPDTPDSREPGCP